MLQVPDHTNTPWLTDAELTPQCLKSTSSLAEAVTLFQEDSDLRLLPIVDRAGQPLGAIFEREIRRLLLNPFGHALLLNPTFGGDLGPHIRPCPTQEMTHDIATLIGVYHRADGREGMILTVGGKLFATLSNRRLLMLAAEDEHVRSKRRLARADTIEQASKRFEASAAETAAKMVGLANSVQQLAEATADRANIAGDQATSVAGATLQTRDSLSYLATRGHGLAAAFEQIELSVAHNRCTASKSVSRVTEGATRTRDLLKAAKSVDRVTELVSGIAGKVNLLSLNATIEAARAGEAGRAFSVVAREIRRLSDNTKEATAVIGQEMRTLRTGIEQVAEDFGAVESAITSMAATATQIDDAISAETDTAKLIATSVTEAGQASATIDDAVATIARSVRTASSSARELDGMANGLRNGAAALQDSVGDFLDQIRTA